MNQHTKVIFLVLSLLSAGNPKVLGQGSQLQLRRPMKIDQKIKGTNGQTIAFISGTGTSEIKEGDVLESYRYLNSQEGLTTKTGELRVFQISKEGLAAQVTKDGNELSQALFPKHPGIMGGDFAQRREITLHANLAVTPEVVMSYNELFLEPERSKNSFELSEKGRMLLEKELEVFANKHVGAILIEGHTDPKGSASENQVESIQRALTVRQFMIDRLGFAEKRVLAVGLGETESKAEHYLPDGEAEARRIVIKTINGDGL